MTNQDIIQTFEKVVIQIATPFNTGTGFYLYDYDLIVTNEHVVRDNQKVVIDGRGFKKQLVEVLYVDPKYDLAFIGPPTDHSLAKAQLGKSDQVSPGDAVLALGHPFGLRYTTTRGIVSSTDHRIDTVDYIQHDAALNPGNSGGPLLDDVGKVVGVNTFVVSHGQNLGFSLPSKVLLNALEEFIKDPERRPGVRCRSCANIVHEGDAQDEYCPFCGTRIKFIKDIEPYEPFGVKRTIETLLYELGQDVALSRRGPSYWEIQQGSARITLAYHEKSGLIIGEAYLCELPKSEIQEIYRYLLQQNYDLEGLSFSVKDMDIVLSMLIYDQYLNEETGKTLLRDLFEKADEYDDLLVNQYNAQWKKGQTEQ